MKTIIIVTVISLALCYRTTQSEKGNQVICSYSTGHILEKQAAVPRQIVAEIKFKKAFDVPPQVFITPQLLDWQVGLPHGYIEKVDSITTTGFKLYGISTGAPQLYSLYVDWFAVYDPRVQVLAFESKDLAALSSGEGERKVTFTLQHNLADATNGIVALTGVRHLKTNPIVEVKVDQITGKSVSVIVRTYWLAALDYISFNVLLGTDQTLWTSPAYTLYNAPESSHPFCKRSPGAAEVSQTVELPKVWQTGPRIPIVTIRGYDIERAVNMRLSASKTVLENKLTYSLNTWWDSKTYGVFHQASIYVVDNNYKIFDPNCAELFSECDYKGDSITICDRNPDLPANGWSKPIKSLTVPVQRRLYLFNKENYEGQKTSFIANQSCLESLTFTFAQLQSYTKHEEVEEHPIISQ